MALRSVSENVHKPSEGTKEALGLVTTSQKSGFQELQDAASSTNPRKRQRTYHRDSTAIFPEDSENVRKQQEEEHSFDWFADHYSPSPKRSRAVEWPLKNTSHPLLNDHESVASPPAARHKKKPPRRRSKKPVTRPSKFQEGSLNDKPSSKPPNAFIGAEDAMEQYSRAQEAGFDDGNVEYDAAIEVARPTTVFRFGRFGKAVASAWHGIWKERETPAVAEKDTVLDERKAKAEEAYAELKKSGFRGTKPSCAQLETQRMGERKSEDSQGFQRNSFRDSAIDVEESGGASVDTTRTMTNNEGLKPPSMPTKKCSTSSMSSDLGSGHRSSSLHLRTPSFQSLKKVKSQMHIPSIIRPATTAPPVPTNESSHQPRVDPGPPSLRRQPSKKDLAKYQRLTKKVSDLESKLDLARRDLQQSLLDVPPVPSLPAHLARKPFTPGALASLPSERLLTPQPSGTPPVPRSNTEIYGAAFVSSPSAQLDRELHTSFNVSSRLDTQILSSDPLTKLETAANEQACWLAAQTAGNPASKTRNKEKEGEPVTAAPRTLPSFQSKQLPSIDGRIPSGIKKRNSKRPSRTPKNSPARSPLEIAPPVPTIAITADEANRPRSESPFLGRPVVISPVRTRSKGKKRGISPPPSSLASAGKKRRGRGVGADVEVVLKKAKSEPAPTVKAGEKGGKEEEFEWDEDVF